MKDDFYYQRGVLKQQQLKLNKYTTTTISKINEQENKIKLKNLEIEQKNKRLITFEQELNEREEFLEREKKLFDQMNREYNQKKIDLELRNAQLFNDKMLEIEKKEREVLTEREDLEITKKYLNKQRNLYKKERELIHLQQEQVFFNEKQLKKQQDLMTTDQTYIKKEFIDAREKFENDRYVLIDKINNLEIENNKFRISEQELKKELLLKQSTNVNLEDNLSKLKKEIIENKQEINKFKSNLFTLKQEITNLKQENKIKTEKILKYENEIKINDEKNLKQLQQFSTTKTTLENGKSIIKIMHE